MKIVFIINSISAQRCIKRVEEFITHGFEVDVYGFSRNMSLCRQPKTFSLEIIGEFENTLSFKDRMPILRKGIKRVLKKYKNDRGVIFYLFQLDVALTFRLLYSGKKYFYEESDLMHTYIRNKIVKRILEYVDKKIIKDSLLTVFTSEGFLNYHYGSKFPHNTWIIANKLSIEVDKLTKKDRKKLEDGKLKVGFVGFPRYKSVVNFIDVFCSNYPTCEFHIYGEITPKYTKVFADLQKYKNCFFHGSFSNPTDLPLIYSNIDVVLSTYDVEYENVCYAEPNKIYEAIYFETPIIVSSGTFLEKKVKSLGVGYSVNPLIKSEIISLINSLDVYSIERAVSSCRKVNKKDCLNINTDFFQKINYLLRIDCK